MTRLSRIAVVKSLSGRQTKQLVDGKWETRRTLRADGAICYVANLRKQLIRLQESPFVTCRHCPRNSPRETSGIVGMADSLCPWILTTASSKSMLEFFHDSPTFEWCLHKGEHTRKQKFGKANFSRKQNSSSASAFCYHLKCASHLISPTAYPRPSRRLQWAFQECHQPTRPYSLGRRPHDHPVSNLMTDNIKGNEKDLISMSENYAETFQQPAVQSLGQMNKVWCVCLFPCSVVGRDFTYTIYEYFN